MIKVEITTNDAGQRLDRFLKKYLKRAPLSGIYKIIRKDLKLNGKRASEDTLLNEGDELTFYMSDERFNELTRSVKKHRARRNFAIAYEDDNILIASKPRGLLTHGDSHEKKNTLMNQVCGYLQQRGEYDPVREKSFTPSPANRLDRNTTGLVIFGKNAAAMRILTKLLRQRDAIFKYYVTLVHGRLAEPMEIEAALIKDGETNRVRIGGSAEGAKGAKSAVRPLKQYRDPKSGQWFSLIEVELITGRTHQIRVHLASKGYPLAGDSKYGHSIVNKKAEERMKELGVTTQLLHAARLEFGNCSEEGNGFENLCGKVVEAPLPEDFARVLTEIGREK